MACGKVKKHESFKNTLHNIVIEIELNVNILKYSFKNHITKYISEIFYLKLIIFIQRIVVIS